MSKPYITDSSVDCSNVHSVLDASIQPFDECNNLSGTPRAHWQLVCAAMDKHGQEELSTRAMECRRILNEPGVSCWVHHNDGGMDQPWQLDLAPLVIPAEEWRHLRAGLLQRARLLNLMLGDLYGTQRLVRDGFVPAPLVFANPGFLRACQAIEPRNGAYLSTYAADLARLPDGRWRVLADRTQSPAGLGFALENRTILARILPEVIREVKPQPVTDILRIYRDALHLLAPQRQENSSTVLLTPGPRNDAYFEHAYLARLLGLTLVEGDDLSVRQRCLFVKTLDGLRRVETVFRRVNDYMCDPLELRGDSMLGVPGLVEAARAGHVGVTNALGAGLLECPGFMPFLPGICRHLLNEDLRLPSLNSWWCGQANEHAQVRDRFDDMIIRSALNPAGTAIRPENLNDAERADLLKKIQLHPHEFVGQEAFPVSHAPTWINQELVSSPVVWRVFVIHDGSDFIAMAGGLARIVSENCLFSFPLNGHSKDVWILSDNDLAGSPIQTIAMPQPMLERAPSDLPSRTADNFFWLGRYTERLEQTVRVARCALRYLSDDSSILSQRRIMLFQNLLQQLGYTSKLADSSFNRESLQKEIFLLLFQDGHSSGMRDLLYRIQQTTFSVRDRLSADTWRILNRFGQEAPQPSERLQVANALSALHKLVLNIAAFSGMEMENMTRGHGWTFLDMGRRLERGAQLARLMEVVLRNMADSDLLLEPALEICDSVMTHRQRYFAEPHLDSAMDVLVNDPANPRSLAFQTASLERHAFGLPTGSNPEGVAVVQRRINKLSTTLQIIREGTQGNVMLPMDAVRRAELLLDLATGFGELSDLFTQVFFSHITPQVS